MAKKNTTVRIDTVHEQMLVAAAESQGSTQSEVVREALGDYFSDLCDRDEEFAKSWRSIMRAVVLQAHNGALIECGRPEITYEEFNFPPDLLEPGEQQDS